MKKDVIRALGGGLFSAVLTSAIISATVPACGTSNSNSGEVPGLGDDSGADSGTGEVLDPDASDGSATGESDGGDGGRPDLPLDCSTDCTGKCGQVRKCGTRELLNCGGCAASLVCDAETHACQTAKTSCADFTEFGATGAKCGIVTLSCGARIKCGNLLTESGCNVGEQCNPDTHQCGACTITPEDVTTKLGFTCGVVPNGCGGTLDLGPCAMGNCGLYSHRCEVGPALADIAAFRAAYPDTPSECGLVTNNFGGSINAGNCPSGQTCGTGGVANRCSAPSTYDPCVVEGRTCGNAVNPTACGGGTKYCGGCTAGNVCSVNGTCIDPMCVPATGPADAGMPQCHGTGPDGCGGNYPTKTCPAGDGGSLPQVCRPDNTCCQPMQVLSGTDPCTNGNVSDGCANVNRACVGANKVCLKLTGTTWSPLPANSAGNCCLKKTCAGDYAGRCGTGYDDGCGGTIDCGLANCAGGMAGNTCNAGTCCALPAAPVCGTQCSGMKTATNACGSRSTNCSLANCPGGMAGNTCDGTGTCCALPAAPVCGTQCSGMKTATNACGSVSTNCALSNCPGGAGGNTCDGTGTCCALPAAPVCGTQCSGMKTATNACGSRSTNCALSNCPGGAAGNTCDGTGTCCALPAAPACGSQCSGMATATNACGSRSSTCTGAQCTGSTSFCGTAVPNNMCCAPPAAPSCGSGPAGVGNKCSITVSSTNACTTLNQACSCPTGLSCSSAVAGVEGSCRKTCGGAYSSAGYAGKCGTNLSDGVSGTITCLACGAGKRCATPPAMHTPGTAYDCICDPDPSSLVCPPAYTGPLYDSCGVFVKTCTG